MRRAQLAASTAETYEGVTLYLATSELQQRHLERLKLAIDRIRDVDQGVWSVVAGRLKGGIAVVDPLPSQLWSDQLICAIALPDLEYPLVQWPASVILHESCHARMATGLGRTLTGDQAELVCLRRQLRFLGRMEQTAGLQADIAAGLAALDRRIREAQA